MVKLLLDVECYTRYVCSKEKCEYVHYGISKSYSSITVGLEIDEDGGGLQLIAVVI